MENTMLKSAADAGRFSFTRFVNFRSLMLLSTSLLMVRLACDLRGSEDPVRETLDVRGIVVRDREGRKRATLGMEGGTCVQSFLDTNGRVRLQMGVDDKGLVGLTVLDNAGKQRFDVSLDMDGDMSVSVYSGDEKPSYLLSVETDGSVGEGLIDRDGNNRISSGIDKDNAVRLQILDKDKKPILLKGDNHP